MAEVGARSSDIKIHKAVDALEENQTLPQQQEDSNPQHCSDSDHESIYSLGLSGDSRSHGQQEDQGHLSEEQLEKLKKFLSEAAGRGDDVVTQSDADTVRALENMQNLQLGKAETGLGARLESAARANLEIQNQAASGYYPSETVYLEEHTLKEVLEESGAVIPLEMPEEEVSSYPPTVHTTRAELASPDIEPIPTKNIDAESALKDELDCLFQERAQRLLAIIQKLGKFGVRREMTNICVTERSELITVGTPSSISFRDIYCHALAAHVQFVATRRVFVVHFTPCTFM
ncbi:hypothetical protein R1sor_011590 [Riccia sorocarpa]|uniref:SMP domain-containing protein n=1 Tax=Riccia sorocarpa TaxID=122646 RepID=A0ABD3I4R3_9MARC